MNHKKTYGFSIGTSSILIIIVILCLVSFAGLSVVSANADYKLSQKLADRTTSYYRASSLANEKLAKLHHELSDIYMESSSEDSFYQKIKESCPDSLRFSCTVSDTQVLSVSVEPVYPAAATDSFFYITDFSVVTVSTPELDDTLPVFLGN